MEKCDLHKSRELKYYCKKCAKVICIECILSVHKGHDNEPVIDVRKKPEACKGHDKEPQPVMDVPEKQPTELPESIQIQLNEVSKALAEIDSQYKLVTDQQVAVKTKINKTSQELHVAINTGQEELIRQLNEMTEQKLRSLLLQKDRLKGIQVQLSMYVETIRSCREGESDHAMIEIVARKFSEAAKNFTPTEAAETANIKFTAFSGLIQICQKFGKVYFRDISPENSYATGKGLDVGVPGEMSTAILHAINEFGEECTQLLDDVDCTLVSDLSNQKFNCQFKQCHADKNLYEINYQPTIRGRHQLHIKVEGEHIKGSPFTVMVKLPIEKLKLDAASVPIKTIDELNQPWGIAVNQWGEVIVAENGGHCVSIIKPDGKKKKFGTMGKQPTQFKYPNGVAVDDDDNILVVDNNNHRIQKFTRNGIFITTVGREGTKPLEFSFPCGIAIHPHTKNIYMTDTGNSRVQILSPDLAFIGSFGSCGSKNGQLKQPWDIAIDNTGNVYVADSGNRRIEVFTTEGKYLRKFQKEGVHDEVMCWPSGITIDSEGVVYVSEGHNHHVFVFTKDCQLLASLGTSGNKPGQFKFPRGITVDKSGIIYVSDMENGRIEIF